MKALIQQLRFYYFYSMFGLYYLRLYPRAKKLLKKGLYREAHAWRSKWAMKLLRAGGLRPELILEEEIDFTQTYIICSNHASYLDIPLLTATLPMYFGFMGKAGIAEVKLVKSFFETIGIAVERENSAKSATSFKKSLLALREGRSIMIFPEGGMFPEPTIVKPLKEGAFQMAARLNIPILVVGLPDNYKILPESKKIANKGRIRLILHKPIPAEGKTAVELKDMVHALLQEDIDKYADEN